ncbi:hypothetical protein ABT095_21110 [Kitasatospora sp. NPDC002227]|uniref:hypothetical protein n=1 Tax=Kitasatospora sp. NPDC002227 TaxID=3154773 RepID=UPI00331E4F23
MITRTVPLDTIDLSTVLSRLPSDHAEAVTLIGPSASPPTRAPTDLGAFNQA